MPRFIPGQLVWWIDHNGVQRHGRYVRLVSGRTALVEGEGATRGSRQIAIRFLETTQPILGIKEPL